MSDHCDLLWLQRGSSWKAKQYFLPGTGRISIFSKGLLLRSTKSHPVPLPRSLGALGKGLRRGLQFSENCTGDGWDGLRLGPWRKRRSVLDAARQLFQEAESKLVFS